MFDFLKPKPKEPIPIFEGLVTDMHCHLLPGVDDGCRGCDDTIACLQDMKKVGFSKVFCTPHYQYPRYPNVEEDIIELYDMVTKDIRKLDMVHGIELVGVAGEYRIDSGFQQRIEDNKFLLVDGKYLLVELSLHQQAIGIEDILFKLQMKNYEIILAHPERYPYFSSQSPHYSRLKDMGIMFQTNILSLSGFYGEQPRQKAFEMIEDGWVEFLGTDTHNTLYTRALMDATHDKRIQKMMERHGHKFLNNKLTHPEPPKKKF